MRKGCGEGWERFREVLLRRRNEGDLEDLREAREGWGVKKAAFDC